MDKASREAAKRRAAERSEPGSATQRAIEEDRDLTKALKDTFPASDPFSVGEVTGAEVAHGGGPARPGEAIRHEDHQKPSRKVSRVATKKDAQDAQAKKR